MAYIRLARKFNRPDVDAFLDELTDEQLFEQMAFDEAVLRQERDARRFQVNP